MTRFTLKTAWNTRRQPGTQIHLHTHNFYEIVYYLRGSGTSLIGDTLHSIVPHSFVIIPPLVEHAETHISEANLFCIGFQTSEILDPQMLQDKDHSIYQIGKSIIQETTDQSFLYEDMALIKLQELYLKILRLAHANDTFASKNFEYVINYLSQNFHERIALADMAEQLHLSYDYFQHRFKAITGFSPQQFLIQKRLDAARQLLENTNLSCTEISYRCGFSNSAQFSAIFKRELGQSPRNYKIRSTK